ncbi:MAG TPA: FHA domain-containing protein, partial [Planctomycetota bacterium]|nr:FHA domain-containing protein [Planctomycetota bacterium]
MNVVAEPARLSFRDERGEIVSIPLDGRSIRIGRLEDCEVSLRDPRVSRLHARVEAASDHHLLLDARSANGTLLNGLRIPAGSSFVLRDGDVITVGDTKIAYGRGSDALEDTSALGSSPDRSFAVADLLPAGSIAADEDVAAEFLRAFAAETRAHALGRCLDVIGRKLEAQTVAIFVPRGSEGIAVAAASPDAMRPERLAEMARPIMASERARLVRPGVAEAARLDETQQVDMVSAAA